MHKILGKKRAIQQTSTMIRKETQHHKHRIKKLRTDFLSHDQKLLMFPLRDDFKITSKKLPNDCFICCLEYLGIIEPRYANLLRSFVSPLKGVTETQALEIVSLALPGKIILPVDIDFSFNRYIFDHLPPNHGILVGLRKDPTNIKQDEPKGHMVLFVRDVKGTIGIIDTQADYVCSQRECDAYLLPYQDQPFLTFVEKVNR